MQLKQAIAMRIKEELKSRLMSAYKLSKLTTVPESTISTLLNGNIKTIKMSTLFDICSGLNIELKDFFDRDYFKLENLED